MKDDRFRPLNLAVLTVSDTRNAENDTSGNYLAEALRAAGHQLAEHRIVRDDVYQIRAQLSLWIADSGIHGVLMTGGTGFTQRDSTPEAVSVLLDKEVPGYGELFRQLSHQDIGSSTIQSRALAGLANSTIVFCLPGSTNACRLGWEKIIREQLDSTHRPCNFAALVLNS